MLFSCSTDNSLQRSVRCGKLSFSGARRKQKHRKAVFLLAFRGTFGNTSLYSFFRIEFFGKRNPSRFHLVNSISAAFMRLLFRRAPLPRKTRISSRRRIFRFCVLCFFLYIKNASRVRRRFITYEKNCCRYVLPSVL